MQTERHSFPEIPCLIGFKAPVGAIALPAKFTFPFHYDPHPLCRLAAAELQAELQKAGWDEEFGVAYEKKGGVIGKMFGVLVVQDAAGDLHYLAAFSGKLAGKLPVPFVPPVFDLQTEGRFFLEGEQQLNAINSRVDALENAPELTAAKMLLQTETERSQDEIAGCKQRISAGKAARKLRREQALTIPDAKALETLNEALRRESLNEHYFLKDLVRSWKSRLAELEEQVTALTAPITALKEERRNRSAALQRQLFEAYSFLDSTGASKSLPGLFAHMTEAQPPSGAGECAAPRLLQYAFRHGLKPLAMAEFWWGRAPGSEIRKHGNFYPACRGKCEPILAHMLGGIETDENPLIALLAETKAIPVVYEDDCLVVVNKPAEFLSVPGNTTEDSVCTRLRKLYPEATGPLVAHRLDMSTSGLLLAAKTKEAHEHLQRQFLNRSVKKQYIALLDGDTAGNAGTIALPLRPDYDDRPRQRVCFDHGKQAQTRWEVIERLNGKTRVRFYPVTGRTHQLRVHAAHPQGLNAPIAGDDLYGTKADRLYLHAEMLEFRHPVTQEIMRISSGPPF